MATIDDSLARGILSGCVAPVATAGPGRIRGGP